MATKVPGNDPNKNAQTQSSAIGSIPLNPTPESGAKKAVTIESLLQKMTNVSGLSQEGHAYFQTIEKKLIDCGSTIKSLPISTNRIEGRVYFNTVTNSAINMMASESYSPIDATPAASQAADFSAKAKLQCPNLKVLETVVVHPSDYSRAENMAAFIYNAIEGHAHMSEITIDSFAGERFSIITRKEEVDRWINANSPHTIQARNDNGILVCRNVRRDQKLDVFGTKPEIEQIPFMAIAGYTRFLSPEDSGVGKYIPVFIITDVVCRLPLGNLIPIVQALATDAFIIKSLCYRPYASFAVKGQPNLGNLFTNQETGIPYEIKSMDEYHRFVRESLMNPFLAFDITEGRARPIGIDLLINDSSRKTVVDLASQFFNQKIETHTNDISIWQCQNYNGFYSEQGVLRDTRYVDYLHMVPLMMNQLKALQPLLIQPKTPGERIAKIRELFTEGVESLYITNTVVIDVAYTVAVASLIKNISLDYDTVQADNYSLAPLISYQTNYSAFSVGQPGNQQNVYGQTACIYSL